MSTAAYLMMCGDVHEVRLVKVENNNGRFTFRFQDPKGHGELLQVEFMTSEFRDYDAQMRSLKKLCFDGKKLRGRRPAGRAR